jgi:hypothetical protein
MKKNSKDAFWIKLRKGVGLRGKDFDFVFVFNRVLCSSDFSRAFLTVCLGSSDFSRAIESLFIR